MTIEKCKLELGEQFKGKLNSKDIAALVDGIDGYFKDVDLRDPRARAAAAEFAKKKIIELKIDENKRLIGVEKSVANRAHLDQFADPTEGIKSLIHHSNVEHKSKVPNLEVQAKGIEATHISVIMDAANKNPGTFSRLKDPAFNREILTTLGGSRSDINVGKEAQDMAKAIRTMHDSMYKQKQDTGFAVGYTENYMGRQLHPRKNLQDMGQEKWLEVADKAYNWEKMGVEEADRVDFLETQWDKINDPDNPFGVTDDFTKIVTTGGKKVESSRSVIFKDGEALADYYDELGINYFENLLRDVEADSRQISAANRFGPDFNKGWKKSMDDARNMAKAKGDKALTKFDSQAQRNQDLFDLAVFGAQNPGHNLLAKAGDKARKFQDMVRLQTALPSTVTDFGIGAGVISKLNGKNYLQNQAQLTGEFFKLFTSTSKRRAAAQELNVFMEDLSVFQFKGRVGEGGRIHDIYDKTHMALMKATGLPRQAVAMRTAISKMLSTDLGNAAKFGWDELYPGKKIELEKVGIGAKEWEILQDSVTEWGDGNVGITPEAVRRSSKGNPKSRRDASVALSSYFTQLSELGSPTPGIKRQAWKQSLDPNTIMGQLARFVGQYKSFSLSQLDSMAFIAKDPNKKFGDIKLTAATMAMSTALGYIAIMAKDAAKGREMRDPTDTKTWADAFIQGGAGLIYADYVFTDYTKSYRSLAKDIAGPAIGGTGSDVAELFAATVRTDFTSDRKRAKLIKKAFKTMERNSPTIPFKKAILGKEYAEAMSRAMNGDFR